MNNDLSFREFMNSFNKKNVGTKSELEVYLDALKGFSVADFQDGSLKVIKNKLLSLISDNKELMSRKKVMLAVCGLRSEERRDGKECRSRWSQYH